MDELSASRLARGSSNSCHGSVAHQTTATALQGSNQLGAVVQNSTPDGLANGRNTQPKWLFFEPNIYYMHLLPPVNSSQATLFILEDTRQRQTPNHGWFQGISMPQSRYIWQAPYLAKTVEVQIIHYLIETKNGWFLIKPLLNSQQLLHLPSWSFELLSSHLSLLILPPFLPWDPQMFACLFFQPADHSLQKSPFM